MKMSELVAVLRDIKAQYGDIDITINQENVIEQITVIERTNGSYVTLSGSRTRIHPIVAKGNRLSAKAFYQILDH